MSDGDDHRLTDAGHRDPHDVRPGRPGGVRRGARPGRAGQPAVHARHLPHDVPRPRLDHAAVRRHGGRRRDERRASATCWTTGQTGLSVAFDLPTQMGYDSDHPRAEGEVGKTGVAIDSVDDMRRLLEAIPLDKVTTSMTINATAPILLLLYELVAEEQGIPATALGGTVQNDILKEYAARGTYIYPPKPSMRLITDLFAYCRERIPKWNTISISGYHMREAGRDGGAGDRVHAGQRRRVRRGGAGGGPGDRRLRAAAVVLLRVPHELLRGGGEVPRGAADVGPDHARALPREGPEERDAALPHADGRRDAHRAAAREQHRAHDHGGAGGGAGRDAVAAHQLVRRGAGAADRERGHGSRCGPSRSSRRRAA